MQTFAKADPDFEFTQQLAAQIPWGQNVILLDKIPNEQERFWYMQKAIENALVAKIRDFLLELGAGFAFMGSHSSRRIMPHIFSASPRA